MSTAYSLLENGLVQIVSTSSLGSFSGRTSEKNKCISDLLEEKQKNTANIEYLVNRNTNIDADIITVNGL